MKNPPLAVISCGALYILFGLEPLLRILNGPTSWSVLYTFPPGLLGDLAELRVLVGLSGFVGGIGLILLQNWARLLCLIVAGIRTFMALFMTREVVMGFFSDPLKFFSIVDKLIGPAYFLTYVCIYGFIFWWLLRPGVKAQFISKTTNR